MSKAWNERTLSKMCRSQEIISAVILVLIRLSWDAIIYDPKVLHTNVTLNWNTSCALIKQSLQQYFSFYGLILRIFNLQITVNYFVSCKLSLLCMIVLNNFLEIFFLNVTISDAHFCILFC